MTKVNRPKVKMLMGRVRIRRMGRRRALKTPRKADATKADRMLTSIPGRRAAVRSNDMALMIHRVKIPFMRAP
jgi:hypothetical protein